MIKTQDRYPPGWGEATRVSETVPQPFRYAGSFYEPTADLYWLRAKWHDTGTGRFLSRDCERGNPLDLETLSRYAFALCNSPTMSDPTGFSPTCKHGKWEPYPRLNCAARQPCFRSYQQTSRMPAHSEGRSAGVPDTWKRLRQESHRT